MNQKTSYSFFPSIASKVLQSVGNDSAKALLKQMLLIRQFELRAEGAYMAGHIGGFFHSYIGQEAIQTAAVHVLGQEMWYISSYRCHALALLLGVTPREIMAELFGKVTGNAKGRGGSMHLFNHNMLGGFGIVTGQVPIATGAAFSIKYQNQKDKLAICFLGEGAIAQGAFHESLNLAALWKLPCIYVVENNQWGMGTHYTRALANADFLVHDLASSYGMKSFRLDGMDLMNCIEGFKAAKEEVLSFEHPCVIECVTERFKGHSISDPGLYRTKNELQEIQKKDPLVHAKELLINANALTQEEYASYEKEIKGIVLDALAFAEESPFPELTTLGNDVFAAETDPAVEVV